MEGKENIFVSNEIIRLWYVDWSCTVKFIHSFIIFIITILFCSIDLYSLWREFPQFPRFPKPQNQRFSTVPDYQSLKIVPIFGSMLHF